LIFRFFLENFVVLVLPLACFSFSSSGSFPAAIFSFDSFPSELLSRFSDSGGDLPRYLRFTAEPPDLSWASP